MPKKVEAVLGDYRKDDYRAFRVWAESLDGTQVCLESVFASIKHPTESAHVLVIILQDCASLV